jgi:hypothetical protein
MASKRRTGKKRRRCNSFLAWVVGNSCRFMLPGQSEGVRSKWNTSTVRRNDRTSPSGMEFPGPRKAVGGRHFGPPLCSSSGS